MTACAQGAVEQCQSKVPVYKKRLCKRSRYVRFKEQPTDAVHVVEGYCESAEDTWYKRSDYMKIRREVRSMALAFRQSAKKGVLLDDKDFCLRGIEEMACPGRKESMTLSRFESLVTVFDAKEVEKVVGTYRNSIQLASILGVLNKSCTDEARQRALCDARAAELV